MPGWRSGGSERRYPAGIRYPASFGSGPFVADWPGA